MSYNFVYTLKLLLEDRIPFLGFVNPLALSTGILLTVASCMLLLSSEFCYCINSDLSLFSLQRT